MGVKYDFDVMFEKQLATACCMIPRLWGRIGEHLDPELMKNSSAKLAIKAARAVAADIGHGPDKCVMVIQRLRRWMTDGKTTLEEIKKVADMFDTCEDEGLPSEESFVAEVKPILQSVLRDRAVKEAIASYGKKGNLAKTIELENKAERIGDVDTSIGTVFGPASFAEMTSLKDLQRLPLGVLELDSALDGGLQVGGLGVFVGGPGDGKSMMLSHVAAFNVWNGALVGYATLELPRPIVSARVKACMTGVPINALLAGQIAQCQKIISKHGSRMGGLIIQDFTPLATTVEDIKDWVSKIEDTYKRKLDLLIVDYADKMGAKAKKGEKEQTGYKLGEAVYEGLRIFADARKTFCWTASQATRRKDRKKRLELDDIADSMHKARVADLLITLNLKAEEEESLMTFFIAKHRTGVSHREIGPMPTEYECGRIAPLILDT